MAGSLLRRAGRGFAVRDTNRYTLTTEGRGDGLAAVESARADCRRQQRNLASSLATMVSGRFGLQWTVGEAERSAGFVHRAARCAAAGRIHSRGGDRAS